MGIVNIINSFMKKISPLCFFFLWSLLSFSQIPKKFLTHRVKKGENIIQIIDLYNISETQFMEYNPSIQKVGLKRRMLLRIPVYDTETESKRIIPYKGSKVYYIHIVEPKENKWRLAYQYGMTISELDSLNPQITDGLKIGQEIRVRNSEYRKALPEKDSVYNYYKVMPAEGYYRIEKKLGVNRSILDSLNPNLSETGLQVGMVLKIPNALSGKLKIENDLLVERVKLLDSTLQKKKIKLGVLLPFKTNEIIFDSIEDTKRILEERNLHTISLDFYTGVLFALDKASKNGIEIDLTTFDTQNSQIKLNEIIDSIAHHPLDFIVGPLIPSNFDYLSKQSSLMDMPKIAPLSTKPVRYQKNVFQSVTEKTLLRNKMYEYLKKKLDTTQHVVIVADSKNRSIEKELQSLFPWAVKLRPEKSDYIIPELVDSLLLDSVPNKIILETHSFPLIASALSQFNAQNNENRFVQVFTTYRSNAYNNENLSRKALGGIQFTYPTGFKPLDKPLNDDFVNGFIDNFGKPPNKEAIRGYDVVLDAVLRIAVSKDLIKSLDLGETQYQSNRFLYMKNKNNSFLNNALYILEHQGYEIFEIKE
jgi:LysM repeat protein/ABC-type branched-subunit amino acid transport system substrate-binding protein